MVYLPNDGLALNLGRTKDWRKITRERFSRLAERIHLPPDSVLDMIDAAVEDIVRGWHEMERSGDYPEEMRTAIAKHMRALPLFGR